MTRRDLLAVGGLLTAAGCRPQTNYGERTADGRVTIRFWNGFTGPDGKTMETIVNRFRQENPDIAVSQQLIPWGTYYDKLTLSLAYGGAPDVFIIHAARLPEFASFGVLRPLDGLLDTGPTPLTAADFAPVPWKATFYRGTQYALPLDVHPIGLYYNEALFEKAGIVDAAGKARPPRTWEEFLDAARRMTRDTDGDGVPNEWGFVFTWQRTNFLTFAAQFGGGILTPDNGHAAMNSPQNIEAAHRMRDLIYRHRVAPRPEGVDAWLAFRQGRVGMAMEGVYMLSSLEDQKGLRFAGAPVPRFGVQPGVWGGSHLLASPLPREDDGSSAAARQERIAAAGRFMRYLSDHNIAWAKGGQVPVRRDAQASPEFRALPIPYAFARQVSDVVYEPLIPKGAALFPFVDPAIEAVLLDLQTPEDAFNDAQRRLEQVLSRP
jgi:multiple sugar transport system substrate-binding protein